MTLDQWLLEAAGTFPRGVRERLAQDYRTHLEESIKAGGNGNVQDLFGNPTSVRKLLRKTYLDKKQFQAIIEQKEMIYWSMTVLLLFFQLPIAIALSLPFFWMSVLLTFTLLLVIWRSTKKLEQERRVMLRNILGMMIIVVIMTANQMGQPHISNMAWLSIIFAFLSFAVSFPYIAAIDRRLRRTLELEKVYLDKRRIDIHSNH